MNLWNELFTDGMWGFDDGSYGAGLGSASTPEIYEIEDIFPLYANGEAVASYTEGLVYFTNAASMSGWNSNQNASIQANYATYIETNYFASDTLGTVRVATGNNGSVIGYADYDVFGNPYERAGTLAGDDLMYAYTGKTWDAVTGLSNYGFRDYAPQLARFTTVDPIKDGSNWYAYVHNDPANCVDLWGLEYIKPTAKIGQDAHSFFETELSSILVKEKQLEGRVAYSDKPLKTITKIVASFFGISTEETDILANQIPEVDELSYPSKRPDLTIVDYENKQIMVYELKPCSCMTGTKNKKAKEQIETYIAELQKAFPDYRVSGGVEVPDNTVMPYIKMGLNSTIKFSKDTTIDGLYYYSIDDGKCDGTNY